MPLTMRSIDLAYLSHARIPSRSANSVHVMRMCDGFADAGCAVTLVARRGTDTANLTPAQFYGTREDVRLEFVGEPPTPLGRVLYSWNGARRALRLGAAVAFGRDLAGCYLAARLGLPVAHETHAPASQLRGVRRALFLQLIRHANFRRLVVITHTLSASYEREFGLPPNRILVCPDAASDLTTGANPSDSPTRSRAGRLSVGYVGHLYPGKGMEMVATLAHACPWADFHVVGGRDEDLGVWRDRCRLQANLRFHGFVPHSQVGEHLAGFDVVLAPLQQRVTIEGRGDISTFTSPLKLFEYMAAGKPILCSELAVLREVMQHEVNCLLVRPDDVEAWHAALLRLRDDRDLRARLKANAYRDFRNHYTWRARADRILAALQQR